MPHQCKICGEPVKTLYTIQDIPFEHCATCDFLQNFYWEEHPTETEQQTDANDKRRALHWPSGNEADMRRKGWETLELMFWSPAWFSRQLHNAFKQIPGYKTLVQNSIKQKKPVVMDFGCGHGTLALQLREKDNLDTIGLDPYSPTDSPYINRKTLTEAKFPDNHFDGIITVETMEHIGNVLPVFRELNRILKPGGVLFIQTRRLEDADYQKERGKWFYLEDPKTHVSVYSEKSLRKIAEKTGFSRAQFRGTRTARLIK